MIIGHQSQIQFFKNFLEKELYFSGFLFSGPEQIGKKLIAQEFIQGLICQNKSFGGCSEIKLKQICPACADNFYRDYLLIDQNFNPKTVLTNLLSDDLNPYGINTGRAIIKFLSTAPGLGRKKTVLIDNAHLLTHEAQNSLLKIIEEPPINSVLILVSHLPSEILETIQSRLMEIKFGLVKKQELDAWIDKQSIPEELKIEAKRYALFRPGRAQEFIDKPELVKQFKGLVLKLLRLEQKTPAEKIIFWEKHLIQKETEPDKSFSGLFELWQIILRDELYQAIGLTEPGLLLTKKRQTELKKLLLTLKKIQVLANLSQRYGSLKENALKQVALMV
ncbi:MAG: hypothetical protein AB1721_02505 [Patescibacteria group bacterium]